MAGLVNQTRLAQLLEVTPKTIRAWEAQGCPVEAPSPRRGVPSRYNVAEVVRWREQRAALAVSGDLAAMDMDEARRRKLAAEAALVEIDLAKARGEVVEVAIVWKVVGDALSACRSRLLAIGATVAPRLDLAPDVASRRAMIDDEVHQALEEISGPDFAWSSGEAEEAESEAEGA